MSKQEWPTLDELWNALRRHAEKGLGTLEVIGKSAEGREIPMFIATDRTVADDNKEIILTLSGEHGDEVSAINMHLMLLDWLTTKEAADILRTQIVMVIPCVNVDGYTRCEGLTSQTVDLFVGFASEGQPLSPEAVAVLSVIDRYKPDALVNTHSGRYDNLRHSLLQKTMSAFHPEIAEMMNLAADEEGWPQGRDSEFELFPAPGDPLSRISRPGRPAVPFSSNMSYTAKKYHTLSILMHADDPREGVPRLKKLLQIGSSRWPTEYYKGYPNRIMKHQSIGLICACGKTASQRRASRVELTENSDGLFLLGQPYRPGSDVLILHRRTKPFIRHGAGIRFRIPKGSKVRKVTFNDEEMSQSEDHGYFVWDDPRWTVVQVNILKGWPEGSTRAKAGDTLPADLAVVHVKYDLP
jgi:hypothetical protein